jgi:predicted nucleic acid-binding protein
LKSCVLDASIAAKWLLPRAGEPLAAEALELLDAYRSGELRFLVPDLFWAELGNVIWKSVRLGRLSKSAARIAMESLVPLPFPTFPAQALLESAFRIASTFDRSVYDCLYVALAVTSGVPLITADEKLASALGTHLPVMWLGAAQL